MRTTSMTPAVPQARRDASPAIPALPWMPALPSVPWELLTQALTLQSALWMAGATLQAQWLSESVEALGRLPGWMLWHNGMEQLA